MEKLTLLHCPVTDVRGFFHDQRLTIGSSGCGRRSEAVARMMPGFIGHLSAAW